MTLRALNFGFFVISTCAIFGASTPNGGPPLLFVPALVVSAVTGQQVEFRLNSRHRLLITL